MWILILILVLAGAGAAMAVSEKKRQEKHRRLAEERRKKRMEALAKAREMNQLSYDHLPYDGEDGEELNVGEPADRHPAEEMKQEKAQDTRIYEPLDEKAEEAAKADDTQVVPEKLVEEAYEDRPQKSFVVDEAALDVLTGKFDYISEEMEEKEARKRQKRDQKLQKKEKTEDQKDEKASGWAVLGWALGAIGCIAAMLLFGYYFLKPSGTAQPAGTGVESSDPAQNVSEGSSEPSANQSEAEGDSDSQVSEPAEPPLSYQLMEEPHAVEATQPSNWNITWEIFDANDTNLTTFDRVDDISFGDSAAYFALPGIATFRGGNFRESGSFGTVNLSQKKFSSAAWTQYSASIPTGEGDGSWTGSGWTGQPLVVQWDDATKQIMNLYDSAKAKDGLIEVIYATLDGTIYFMDLETGEYTRDSLYLGMTFKGSGALDPRGYPLMYVGSGDFTLEGRNPHMYVISLIDGSVLYEYGGADPVAMRGWCGFDSSPLVDAETDTLIWPGENGVLYTIKLNTAYDAAAGTISIDPELTARIRYTTGRSSDESYWLGFECSVGIIDRYAYLSENGGMFYCINLDTMELVWAQDTKDDSNSTPVIDFDPKTGRGYIYTAPSLHWTAEDGWGSISIYKLDAITGEIVWQKEYDCGTVDGVSGGVQATPVIGRTGTNMEGLIIYPIARTPDLWGGAMVALDQTTGEEVWRWDMDHYAWSSPVAVYNEAGEGYLVAFDSQGGGFLLDGATGQMLDTTDVGSLVEATPVVYNNRIVVGTRGQLICGIDLQ